jgi:hypothetical protein
MFTQIPSVCVKAGRGVKRICRAISALMRIDKSIKIDKEEERERGRERETYTRKQRGVH